VFNSVFLACVSRSIRLSPRALLASWSYPFVIPYLIRYSHRSRAFSLPRPSTAPQIPNLGTDAWSRKKQIVQ